MEQELMPDYLNLRGSFDEQVRNIMHNVRLTRQEVENLILLFNDLEGALQSAWPDCKLVPFGSIVTGLGMKTSDVDCFIELPEGRHYRGKRNIIKARKLLYRKPWLFQNLFAITTAKVPILKLFHTPTQRNCDISFKSPAGVRNSMLMAHLLHMDNRAVTLAILIKYWSKVHNLTGTNMVPNYGLIMLVIFYLQQIDILPSVSKLQYNCEKYLVDEWNTAYSKDFYHNTSNSQTLYELLGGFFKFYSSINFDENIISPFTATLIPRNLFKTPEDTPSEFELYKINVSSKKCDALRIDTKICVQDPFEHNRNCTVSVYPRLAATLVSHFKLASQIYEENSPDFFMVDLLVRKPASIQSMNKSKIIDNKIIKTKFPVKVTTQHIKNGHISKPQKKKGLNYNLEALYRKGHTQR